MAVPVAAHDPEVRVLSALAPLALGLFAAYGGELSDVKPAYAKLKRSFREAMKRDPIDSLLAIIVVSSYLFYIAERDVNPKVNSVWDAVEFITTNLSVGYCDIFARTVGGEAVASFVMTFGPALTAAAFDPPAAETQEAVEINKAILSRLDAILEALQKT